MKRRERRQRQNAREMERRKREKQGLRGHYISVNGMGIPSGFGVGAWRQELNKLCTALDPSILDIRHQLEEAMSTLQWRLKDNFKYMKDRHTANGGRTGESTGSTESSTKE